MHSITEGKYDPSGSTCGEPRRIGPAKPSADFFMPIPSLKTTFINSGPNSFALRSRVSLHYFPKFHSYWSNSFTNYMASQSDLEPVRKRQRKAKSCQPCRDRKVRCDQATPCGPCQRSRDHLRCTYRDLPQDVDVPATNAGGALRPEPTKLPLPANGYHPSPSSGGWTSMNAPNSATSPNNGPTHVFNGPNVAPRPHEGVNASLQDVRIRELEARVRRLEEEAAAVAQSRSTQPTTPATDLEAGNNAANQETMIDSIAPRLRVSSEKSKLFGPSHWVHTADKVEFLPTRRKQLLGSFADAIRRYTSSVLSTLVSSRFWDSIRKSGLGSALSFADFVVP